MIEKMSRPVTPQQKIDSNSRAAYIAATAKPFSRFDAANLAILAGDYARHAATAAFEINRDMREWE